MKVLLLSRYGQLGASSRIRSYQYLPYLSSHDIDVVVAPLFSDSYITRMYAGRISMMEVIRSYFNRFYSIVCSRNFDLIWIEKEMLPWIPSWIEFGLVASQSPIIVDYDDALFHRYDQHDNILIRKLMGGKIDNVMRRADVVLVGNRYLGNRARQAGASRIEYLPTAVDVSRYHVSNNNNNNRLIIGWIGSPGTTEYLQSIADVFRTVVINHPNVKFVAVGADIEKLHNCPVEVRSWSEESEVEEIQRFDIGIMPLPDEPFERGKCGYKLIQYMACAKPVVASPVGVNTEIVKNGNNGFLAKNPSDWLNVLPKLIVNKQLRQQFGSAGRVLVESDYAILKIAPRLVQILNEFRK